MKLHGRTLPVQRASIKLERLLWEFQRQHDLTDLETLRLLNTHQDLITRHMLRVERHPDNPDAKADEE